MIKKLNLGVIMSEECKWLHRELEMLPLVKYPFSLDEIPKKRGIYFFYEIGETWGHGGNKPRIVRIGTSSNLRNRIKEHYLFDEKKLDFNKMKSAPKERSIFRENLGRAILKQFNDPYLEVWDIDFTYLKNREKYGSLRDIKKEKSIEGGITTILQTLFSFRFIIFDKNENINLAKSLIGTLVKCEKCQASSNWLGNYSPKRKIKSSGLWQVNFLNAHEIGNYEKEIFRNEVEKTINL